MIAPQKGSIFKTQLRQAGLTALFDTLGWAGGGRQLIETPKALLRPHLFVARSTARVASEHSSIVELIEKEIEPYLTSDTTGGFLKNSAVPTRAFLGFVSNEIEGQARRLEVIVNETNLFCYQNEQFLIVVPKMGSLSQNLLQAKKTICSLNTLVQATTGQNFAHLKICNETAHVAQKNLFQIYKDVASLQYEIGIAQFQQINTTNCKLAKVKKNPLSLVGNLHKLTSNFRIVPNSNLIPKKIKLFCTFSWIISKVCAQISFRMNFSLDQRISLLRSFYRLNSKKINHWNKENLFLKKSSQKLFFRYFPLIHKNFLNF